MPVAEIIAIGTELLLGEIQDTNTRYMARCLRDYGIDLHQAAMVGDNVVRISSAVREALTRSDIVITAGGLGPTVDDPTREAIALAMGVENTFQPELWGPIEARFNKFGWTATENNRRQACLPVGAVAIPNPVGTAPAFYFQRDGKMIISLPGVPRELEYLVENAVLPLLRDKYDLQGLIKAIVVHTSGVGESQVDEWIGDLERLTNPTVGLCALPGQVDIRITAKAQSISQAEALIQPVVDKIKSRLDDAIFGYESDTLESVILTLLAQKNAALHCVEYHLGGELSGRLLKCGAASETVSSEELPLQLADLKKAVKSLPARKNTDLSFGASLMEEGNIHTLHMVLSTPHVVIEKTRSYGGPAKSARVWGATIALDFLRRHLSKDEHREIV